MVDPVQCQRTDIASQAFLPASDSSAHKTLELGADLGVAVETLLANVRRDGIMFRNPASGPAAKVRGDDLEHELGPVLLHEDGRPTGLSAYSKVATERGVEGLVRAPRTGGRDPIHPRGRGPVRRVRVGRWPVAGQPVTPAPRLGWWCACRDVQSARVGGRSTPAC